MLVIWTSDTRADLSALFGPILQGSGVQHTFTACIADVPPDLSEGDVLLCMGNRPMEIMRKHALVPKKHKSIGSLRERAWPVGNTGAFAMFTYNASIRHSNWEYFLITVLDVILVKRYIQTGLLEPDLSEHDYQWADNLDEICQAVVDIYGEAGIPARLSCDLETMGFDYMDSSKHIVSISFSVRSKQSRLVYCLDENGNPMVSDLVLQQINWLLNTPMAKTTGANFKFDQNWMEAKWGIRCTNFTTDTLIIGSLLDENRSNSLENHAKLFTDYGGYDAYLNNTYDKGHMELVPQSDLLVYAGGDTSACYDTAERLVPELVNDPHLTSFYTELLHPAAIAYQRVEQTGVLVDINYMRELQADLEADLTKMEREARGMIGNSLFAKHMNEDGSINLTKKALLVDLFFTPHGWNLKPKMLTEKAEEPSTALDHLKMFKDVSEEIGEFVKLLEQYSQCAKTLSTYVIGFLKHLREDGRYHPTYFMFATGKEEADNGGTVTGRLSVKDPAMQTVPKHTKYAKRLRRAFIAPPGYVIMERDYSQGELRIAADMSGEPTMLQAYQDDKDLHAITAANLAGYTIEDFYQLKQDNEDEFDYLRKLAKASNFGLLYGMGVNSYMEYAYFNYGVEMTIDQATENWENFFRTYSGLTDWHDFQKKFASLNGFVRSPLGRVRHLPLINSHDRFWRSKAERQSVNSPVQSCLSDMSLWATAVWNQRGYQDQCPVMTMIHDALYFYVPEDHQELWAGRGKEVMETLPLSSLGWSPKVAMKSDCKMGPNLAELH